MTKPTITQPSIYYAIFRRDVPFHTADYALQNKIYTTLTEANLALQQLRKEVAVFLASFEVRQVEGGYQETEFGTNPFVHYS